VFCPMEYTEGEYSKHCDLCSFDTDKKYGKTVYGFEMAITKDLIVIKNFFIDSVPYQWDEKTFKLSFRLQGKDYTFRSLRAGRPNTAILKDENCYLLTLTKKEKKKEE
jgi:hypothetical protein